MPDSNDQGGVQNQPQPKQQMDRQARPSPSLLPLVLARLDPPGARPTSQQERLQQLAHPDWSIRIKALANLENDEESLALLLSALQDEHESVRAEAIYLFSQQTSFPLEQLLLALRDPSWQVREAALLTCATRGMLIPRADMERALHDPAQPVREAAQSALNSVSSAFSLSGTFTTPPTSGNILHPPAPSQEQLPVFQAKHPFRKRHPLLFVASLVAVLFLLIGNGVFLTLLQHQNSAQPGATGKIVYGGPLIITRGGTYSGNWQSLDYTVPAVSIRTTEPVTIQRAHIRARGNLIETISQRANLTVRDTYGYGLLPQQAGQIQGYFIQAVNVANLLVEHTSSEETRGIHVDTYAGARDGKQTLKILYNRARNINGRASDGKGSYSRGTVRGKDWDYACFVEIFNSPDVPNVEVGWNEVINEPGKSLALAAVSFYRSGGTAMSPSRIHDNYVQGSYAAHPGDHFSGGGITVGYDCDHCAPLEYGFTKTYQNQVVNVDATGIAIMGGHDQEVTQNRVVSSGKLADGTRLQGGLGVQLWNYYRLDAQHFYNNSSHDNIIGVIRYQKDGSSQRCDSWWPEEHPTGVNTWCLGNWHNTSLPNPITAQTEQAEYIRWQQKVERAGFIPGARL